MIIVLDHKDVNPTIILVLEQQLVVFSQALHAGMQLGAACVAHVAFEYEVPNSHRLSPVVHHHNSCLLTGLAGGYAIRCCLCDTCCL